MAAWQNHLHNDPTDWLLKSNPWTRYRVMTDLLEIPETEKKVIKAKKELLQNPEVQKLAASTHEWIETAPGRNNDPKLSYFTLKVLADFGLKFNELGLEDTIEKAKAHQIEQFFAVRGQEPERPKKGEKFEKPDPAADIWHISPCNAPVITAALLQLGDKSPEVKKSVEALQNRWISDQGWFCDYFFVKSQFNKLQIGCPIAGLMALEVFSLVPELRDSDYIKHAFAPLKFHHEYGKTLYYFGRSKKFWTFKYPFVWYNALYLGEILSRFPIFKDEPVVTEIIHWIIESQDKKGRFKPTSMFMPYKGWDFANKKEASPWITFLCCRILKRYFN